MLFCQKAQAKSLREITAGLHSCEGKLKHLGMQSAPSRSTLSYANAHRPAELFEKLFYHTLSTVTPHASLGSVVSDRIKSYFQLFLRLIFGRDFPGQAAWAF